MKGHYLLVVTGEGKGDFTREYFELSEPDESEESALTRWVNSHPELTKRTTRGKLYDAAERAVRESVEYVKLTHPTSWHAARREAGLDTITAKGARRGR